MTHTFTRSPWDTSARYHRHIDAPMIDDVIEDLALRSPAPQSVLVIGPPEMVASVRAALATLGIGEDRINSELHGVIGRHPALRLHGLQVFSHRRASTPEDLSTQVALSHYSTFSFYEPTVLEASLEEFLQRVRSPVVRWADENLLVTVHRKADRSAGMVGIRSSRVRFREQRRVPPHQQQLGRTDWRRVARDH